MSEDYGHCLTCKFWNSIHWRTEPISGWNWCDKMQNDYSKDTPHPNSLAVSEDCESYHAHVRTHETFGCVQHEMK